MGHDEWDLWRHRTEPVNVIAHPERILFDMDSSAWFDEFDAAETELQRRDNAVRPSYTYSYSGHELTERMRGYYTDLGVGIVDGPPPPLPTVEVARIDSSIPKREPYWSRELERAWPVIKELASALCVGLDSAEPESGPGTELPANRDRTMNRSKMADTDVMALVQPLLEGLGAWRYIA
ncbi:hypothetical protein BST13_35735 [Mycobacterium aquaticum]|uniref:Uncharacterized protein n=1 Tax=Mycobacterium aquaticum TaxID=1927124 RepID=A0A1W9ZYZ7_9MYCO|nr:hypothetical protein BST13_35735 [Mycobacterium aquaticum]